MKIRVSSVEGNGQKLDGGSMFGNAPRPVWENWLPPDESGRVSLACRSMLVEVDGSIVLCETGVGAFFEPKMAERFGIQDIGSHVLLSELSKLGFSPNDIDYVILSHLHFDHAGGLLTSYEEGIESRLLFPNAKYVIGKSAFARACKPHRRDRASFIPGLTEKLRESGRLLLIDGVTIPGFHEDRISFRFSDGHTPGQMHTLVSGDKTSVFFCGDLAPGIPWVHLPITMGYDRFAEKLIDEKESIFMEAVQEEWLMFFTHDPQVAACRCVVGEKSRVTPVDCQEALLSYEI